jgi:hypothetical protein
VTLRKSISVSKPIWGKRRARAKSILPPMLDGMVKTCEPKENPLKENPLIKKPGERIRAARLSK